MESSLREFRNSFEESLRTKNPPSPTLMLHVENKPSSHWCARWCQFTSSRPLAAGPVDLGRTVSPGPGLSQGPCLPPLDRQGQGKLQRVRQHHAEHGFGANRSATGSPRQTGHRPSAAVYASFDNNHRALWVCCTHAAKRDRAPQVQPLHVLDPSPVKKIS